MHQKLYSQMLRLYPRPFRDEFAPEMAAVFSEALDEAKRRGRLAVTRLWLREISSIGNAIGRRSSGRPNLLLTLAVIVFAAITSSNLIAKAGLFHASSLFLLVAGLGAAGFAFGLGRRIAAVLLVAFALGGALGHDRLSLRTAPTDVVTTLTIPGVRLDSSRVSSPKVYASLVAQAEAAGTPRIRIATDVVDGRHFVRTLRAGGVDGAYMLLTVLWLCMTAFAGARMNRETPLTTA